MGIRRMLYEVDNIILDFVHDRTNCKALDYLMPKITKLGNCGIIWVTAAFTLIGNSKYTIYGYLMLLSQIVGVLLGNVLIKHIVARPRPCWVDRDVPLLIKRPKDYSFPSGHTLSSVTATVILLHTNITLGIISIIICASIIFSRMYLYVHYPSDIFGGVALGITISRLILKIAQYSFL